jgi:hypothetical protein
VSDNYKDPEYGEIAKLRPTAGKEADYRELGPISVCPCGSELWNLKVKFDDEGEVGMYFLDMRCALCDSLATAPTPSDAEDGE